MPAHLLGQHRHLDVFFVLEAVADDGRVVIGQRHYGQQLGFGAGFQTKMIGSAVLHDLFDHLPLLIHLDRVDAEVAALVLVFGNGALESRVDLAQPVFQDIGETDQDRQRDAA